MSETKGAGIPAEGLEPIGTVSAEYVEYVDPASPLPGETYMDGPYLVFNEAYHLRRGYCCNSDCRHCPYR